MAICTYRVWDPKKLFVDLIVSKPSIIVEGQHFNASLFVHYLRRSSHNQLLTQCYFERRVLLSSTFPTSCRQAQPYGNTPTAQSSVHQLKL
mmetsp:Transcript_16303/g.22257  ORF Transcript_16303/g.22257 Transcript_16303/m.22257 type:complete len:91 (-) Transcript_16303:231-503(-)